jgi:hypothetical protein
LTTSLLQGVVLAVAVTTAAVAALADSVLVQD